MSSRRQPMNQQVTCFARFPISIPVFLRQEVSTTPSSRLAMTPVRKTVFPNYPCTGIISKARRSSWNVRIQPIVHRLTIHILWRNVNWMYFNGTVWISAVLNACRYMCLRILNSPSVNGRSNGSLSFIRDLHSQVQMPFLIGRSLMMGTCLGRITLNRLIKPDRLISIDLEAKHSTGPSLPINNDQGDTLDAKKRDNERILFTDMLNKQSNAYVVSCFVRNWKS